MRILLYVLPVVLIAALAAIFALLLNTPRNPQELPSALIDDPVPAFELPALTRDGNVTQKDLVNPDGITVLNVFASWCVPCRAEHPVLSGIARNPKVRLAGLNYKDKPADARAFLDELGNPFDVIAVDEKGRTAIDFGVTGVPETFIVNGAGRIVFKFTGPMDANTYQSKVAPVIAKLTESLTE